MLKPTAKQYDSVCQAYEQYVTKRSEFVDSMAHVGVRVRNVDPFASFAEVIAAHELGGEIQPPANKDFDLLTEDRVKIQVKSLRISSANPGDNWLDWRACTREFWLEGKKLVFGNRIDADRLAVVVFYDFRPYALVDFPIESWEKFPAVKVFGLGYAHVKKLVDGKISTDGTSIRVINLEEKFPSLPSGADDTPPAGGE